MDYSEKLDQKLETMRSVFFQLSPEAEEIQKGIVDDLSHGVREGQMNISKKGSEIKEKLTGMLAIYKLKKMEIMASMKMCVKEIGVQPDEVNSSYQLKKYKHLIDKVPYLYSYSQIYPQAESPSPAQIDVAKSQQISQEMRGKMQRYNNFARDYIEKCIEVLKIQTVVNNIGDKKSYNLTINTATRLGF